MKRTQLHKYHEFRTKGERENQSQLWQETPPPLRRNRRRTRGGFLDIRSQMTQNLTDFGRFSLVKSHFRDPKMPIFSRLRRATQGKSAILEAPQAKKLTFYLVKRAGSVQKRGYFAVLALKIHKSEPQNGPNLGSG